MKCLVHKIISGGQTGADRGGLEAALDMGIMTGGKAPYRYMTENGCDPELKTKFGLVEMPKLWKQLAYPKRSIANVDDSDGTLVFRFFGGIGTDKTIGYCRTRKWKYWPGYSPRFHRPVYVVSEFSDEHKNNVKDWIRHNEICVLNVAGHRESTWPDGEFSQKVRRFLVETLTVES